MFVGVTSSSSLANCIRVLAHLTICDSVVGVQRGTFTGNSLLCLDVCSWFQNWIGPVLIKHIACMLSFSTSSWSWSLITTINGRLCPNAHGVSQTERSLSFDIPAKIKTDLFQFYTIYCNRLTISVFKTAKRFTGRVH